MGYFLTVYIMLCTVLPCTFLDDCEDEQKTTQAASKNTSEDCNNCLPFSACSAGNGFTVDIITATIDAPAGPVKSIFGEHQVVAKSEYFSRLFQPPRS